MRSRAQTKETGIGVVVGGIASATMATRVLVVVSIAIATDVRIWPNGVQVAEPRGGV